MYNRKKFFDAVRPIFGKLNQKQVDGMNALLDEAEKRQLPLHYLAYILATVAHETAYTMQPIKEYGRGRGRKYGRKDHTGKAPYGRGFVQITWRRNYVAMAKLLGIPELAEDYDLALDLEIATQILFEGMLRGTFTGKALWNYIDKIDEDDEEDLREFVNSRRIVNGTDKQVRIGKLAISFEYVLKTSHEERPDPEPENDNDEPSLFDRLFGGD